MREFPRSTAAPRPGKSIVGLYPPSAETDKEMEAWMQKKFPDYKVGAGGATIPLCHSLPPIGIPYTKQRGSRRNDSTALVYHKGRIADGAPAAGAAMRLEFSAAFSRESSALSSPASRTYGSYLRAQT